MTSTSHQGTPEGGSGGCRWGKWTKPPQPLRRTVEVRVPDGRSTHGAPRPGRAGGTARERGERSRGGRHAWAHRLWAAPRRAAILPPMQAEKGSGGNGKHAEYFGVVSGHDGPRVTFHGVSP